MKDVLFNYFQKIVGSDVYLDGDNILIVDLRSSYGDLKLTCDFKDNNFVVEGSVDEDQYCALFMVDEDEIEDLDDWNTTNKYTDISKALERCQDILDSYESESSGSDVFEVDDPDDLFSGAIKLVQK